MQESFQSLAQTLFAELRVGETLLLNFAGETSDFIRFNHGKVRQAGSVAQQFLRLRLVQGARQASASLTLAGEVSDHASAAQSLSELRAILADGPEDPYLLINTEPVSSTLERRGNLPPPEEIIPLVTDAAQGLDLVGIYAAGGIYRGFANSLGQRNWHEVDSFNFEWSLYHRADKAVKSSYAGFHWQPEEFGKKLEAARDDLARIAQPPRTITPGEYRVYLAPRALEEIIGLLYWGGFSLKARRTKRSPLMRMESDAALHPGVNLTENTASGVAPGFQSDGFVKPPQVNLVREGKLADALVAPRTAKEYGVATNGAQSGEAPQSLEMGAGTLPTKDVLAALDTGLYVNNLWYLNYSDRPAARITGMTRFATFWVENGRIVAPANVMRFDDSLYAMLGSELEALTTEREIILDASTYGERSTASSLLPGVLVGKLKLTL